MEKELFWDRKTELAHLKNIYETKNAAFIKVYGRRRIGKTDLILRFLKTLPQDTYLYYYVDNAEDKVYYQMLSDAIGRQLGDTVAINSWDDFFTYIAKKSRDRFVLVIDEAPRFMDTHSTFFTHLQHAWGTDPKLENSRIMLILVGSSIGMMDRMINHHGPLYGRITHTLKLSPFRYVDFREVFDKDSEHDIIQQYAVFGGTPHYVRIAYLDGKKLDEASRKGLESLILPLRDKISDFRIRIDQVHDQEAKERTALTEQIRQLTSLNQQVTAEASRLTTALKGDSKTQGNYGEMILEKILELSGLEKDVMLCLLDLSKRFPVILLEESFEKEYELHPD